MKRNNIFKIAVFCLSLAFVAGIYTFIVIPSVQKEQESYYEKKLAAEMFNYIPILVYNGETPLLQGTIVTEAIRGHFKEVRMPAGCVTSDYVTDFMEICGMQLKYAICKGQQVSFNNFKDFIKSGSSDEKLKEFYICSLVAGQAMPGRYVDILLRYPDGRSAVVVPKVQIYDIQSDAETKGAALKDKNISYTAVFAVNDNEFDDLINACREGTLDIRVYMDDAQKASVKSYWPASSISIGL